MKNADLCREPLFVGACRAAGVEPTQRQASKFQRGKGLAFWVSEANKGRLPTNKDLRKEVRRRLS